LNDERLVDSLAGARVAVIGDVMVDHYVHGAVSRISPEAPVPVMRVRGERHVLGGAAHVAASIAVLKGDVTLVGVVGRDANAHLMVSMLNVFGAIAPELIACDTHPTIVKTRFMSDRQQIVRVDREETDPYPAEVVARVLRVIDDVVSGCDLLVISDYGKGLITDGVLAHAFAAAKAAGKRVIVDPKRVSLADYRGADIITPNRKELELAVGRAADSEEEARVAAQLAIDMTGAAILLTRSEKGMALFRADHPALFLPTEAREVFDVSGAGDTVVATLACALASNLAIETAMRMANAAAGVVVGKVGTAVCTRDELVLALASAHDGKGRSLTPQDAVSWDEARAKRDFWRKAGLTVGFTNGCFDLLHPGHVTLLAKAAQQVDRLIVAINTDASVARLKGPKRPIQAQNARAQVLSSLRSVDLVTLFDQDTPLELIAHLVPDVLFKGADYTEENVVGGDIVKAAGGRVVLIDLVEGQSTSALVDKANT
jgi:D-beta-D-heptose 7-phosphate kinase/D-beta-D-heptose 1-phosphate adenosyltransferase